MKISSKDIPTVHIIYLTMPSTALPTLHMVENEFIVPFNYNVLFLMSCLSCFFNQAPHPSRYPQYYPSHHPQYYPSHPQYYPYRHPQYCPYRPRARSPRCDVPRVHREIRVMYVPPRLPSTDP